MRNFRVIGAEITNSTCYYTNYLYIPFSILLYKVNLKNININIEYNR